MTIKNMVPSLLVESNAKPMDLVRAGLSVGVAYRWANNEISRVDFDVVSMLCRYFSDRLQRPVSVGDVLVYERIPAPADADADTRRELPRGAAWIDGENMPSGV